MTNEQVDEPITNELIVDIEFSNKRELYNHYGIDVKTIPIGYEVKMRQMARWVDYIN